MGITAGLSALTVQLNLGDGLFWRRKCGSCNPIPPTVIRPQPVPANHDHIEVDAMDRPSAQWSGRSTQDDLEKRAVRPSQFRRATNSLECGAWRHESCWIATRVDAGPSGVHPSAGRSTRRTSSFAWLAQVSGHHANSLQATHACDLPYVTMM